LKSWLGNFGYAFYWCFGEYTWSFKMKMKKFGQRIWNWAGSAAIGLCASFGGHSAAVAQVNAANVPLFLSSSVDPNIMFILDDSGSMHWEVTPDNYVLPYFTFRRISGLYGGVNYENYVASVRYESDNLDERTTSRALRSFALNKSYYNPATTYKPWARADGTLFPNAVPTAAFHHPVRTALGFRNLTVSTKEDAIWAHTVPGVSAYCSISCSENALTHFPAVYFRHNGGELWAWGNYTKVDIISTIPNYTGDGRVNRTDCASGSCTYAQEIQNYANWYTYYRSRMLSAQAGIGRAFSTQPESMRVGFAAINKLPSTVDGIANTRTIIQGVRPFAGADRQAFFSRLYESVWIPADTPLRRALDDAGQYFSRADNAGPWGAIPGVNNTTNHLTCRQSFTILMTDGYWSADDSYAATTADARKNVDGSSGTAITADGPPVQTFTYEPSSPFKDGRSNTLADVAMYYWKRDLRPTLENKVPTSALNPAFWQHMVTYGVGLGVSGTIDPRVALAAITSDPPVDITWPDPTISLAAKIDDLLHAGVNSRGGFFSASDPETFATELTSVLSTIVARVSAAGTSAATSAAVLQTDTLLYNAIFRSTDWSGTLVARRLNANGSPDLSTAGLAWDAEQKMAVRQALSRKILTSTEAGVAVDFKPELLSSAQNAALGVNPAGAPASTATNADRINWMYGVDSAQLRPRLVDGMTRRIGDLVGSDPQFMAKKDLGYSMLPAPQGPSYGAFRKTPAYSGRPDTLFVGSNGGMFHAFNATDGNELFAYIPSELLLPGSTGTHAQVNELMRPDYGHRFYVDGSPLISDVYTDGAWRTVAVGAMGAGGRTVFALDVTDPANVTAAKVLWEFKHSNDACVADSTGTSGSRACRDVGFGVTKPKIVRLSSGRWAIVFGNGYNSFDHRARLMVVDLETGRLLYNLLTPDATTEGGSASASNPNGLSPVETTDWPLNSLNLANAYAGDLLGNLWRFNFQGATPTVTRVFTAKDGSSPARRQPITATPIFSLKSNSATEIVLLFGTGSFFKVGDDNTVSPQVQTFYGIFDSASSSSSVPLRSDLLEQVLTSNSTSINIGPKTYAAGGLRFLTENSLTTGQRGWRVDLPSPGERVISRAIFPTGASQKRVRFSTLIPDDDPCGSGRQGFLMDLSILSGGRSSTPAFDFNGDGVSNASDVTGGIQPSGIGGGTGEMPINIRDPNGNTDNIYGGDGSLITKGSNTSGPAGRQSWRQLR
jgi:type IV pilus assembly protein PilY1